MISNKTRKTLAIAAICAAAVSLSACNAVRGLGQDIESVGEAGDRAV